MWTGVATDKNALGALCMISGSFLLSYGMILYSDRRAPNRVHRLRIVGGLLSIAVYLLLMIDSKTALACFLMAASLIALRAFPRLLRPRFITAHIIAMIALVYGVLFLGLGSSALSEMGRDTSLTGRTDVWRIVLPFAVNPWIGAGFEGFWLGDRLDAIILAIGAGLNQAHNGYIELYLNLGWFGLFFLAVLLIAGYRNLLKQMGSDIDIVGLRLAFFFICIVYNFTEAAFKIMSPVWIVFLWAATNYRPAPVHRAMRRRFGEFAAAAR
jgi:O-antigen ligase